MQSIENMLRERMGLDACSIGSSLIQRTVRLRMKNLGLKKEAEYHDVLESSAQEWNELVESVIVTETWFFRDGEPFNAMVRLRQRMDVEPLISTAATPVFSCATREVAFAKRPLLFGRGALFPGHGLAGRRHPSGPFRGRCDRH